MLIQAFAGDVLSRIRIEGLRTSLEERLPAQLSRSRSVTDKASES
jgi:hypothetical protein